MVARIPTENFKRDQKKPGGYFCNDPACMAQNSGLPLRMNGSKELSKHKNAKHGNYTFFCPMFYNVDGTIGQCRYSNHTKSNTQKHLKSKKCSNEEPHKVRTSDVPDSVKSLMPGSAPPAAVSNTAAWLDVVMGAPSNSASSSTQANYDPSAEYNPHHAYVLAKHHHERRLASLSPSARSSTGSVLGRIFKRHRK
ncbi:hypothetical protein T439DRAFT_352340 [Meredithblackwellia eburnea MCA 4105]